MLAESSSSAGGAGLEDFLYNVGQAADTLVADQLTGEFVVRQPCRGENPVTMLRLMQLCFDHKPNRSLVQLQVFLRSPI